MVNGEPLLRARLVVMRMMRMVVGLLESGAVMAPLFRMDYVLGMLVVVLVAFHL